MQTIASEDVPMIYAIAATGEAVLVVANTEGYYREYPVTGSADPGWTDVICASRSGRVYVSDSSNRYIFTSSGSDYSSWSYQAMGLTLTFGIVSTPFGDYSLQDSPSDTLYRYEESSNSWASMGKQTTGNDARKMYYSSTYSSLYIIDDWAYLLKLGTPATLIDVAHYSIVSPQNFFAEVNGGFYVANNVAGLYLNGVLIGPGSGFESYAVVSPAEIFAGNDVGTLPLRLFRLIGGSFVPEIYFPSTGGIIKLCPMPPDHIIIGIANSGSSDGLYVYNFKKKNLLMLSTRQIVAVCTRKQ